MEKKSKKGLIIGIVALLVLAAVFCCIWLLNRPATSAGTKTIKVVVDDGSAQKTFKIKTDEEYLRGALEQKNLIEGSEGEFGLFVTTVNGRTADDTQQEWWCFTKDGEMLMTGVDETPIADGDQFEITLTVGW